MRAVRTWLVARIGGIVSLSAICLMLAMSLVGLHSAAAQQPPQEKRLALVIGNSAYAKGPLATAANDAGLIAQTLQAAGFDVIGARDLDGDTLRKSFRDFTDKVSASGPNTVAMIYLAGYGIQLAGENYFIPVDSAVNRDTDIPTEGLRIGDYLRQLAALPLKADIVVLDAAREQPFITGDKPLAGGLALVEPDNNTLIAFNAAPGTVAPSEAGPYGIYAQSLAEMIRTGGLALPDLFDRVRLRVSERTNGAQIPWDAQKIQVQFAFFDRAPDAPAQQGTPAEIAAIRDRPIRELGAQQAYTAAITRDTMQAYEDFLVAYPADTLAKRVRAILAARREAIIWRRTYRADTPDAYWSYLRRYPRGPHAEDARRRLAILTAPLEPPPSFAMLDYDVPPPPPDEIVYVDRPVLVFSDPDFGFVPPPPPPVFFLPPPPPDFVVLPPPIAPIGLFILPRPLFVPIPAFVRPPTYVAPPPNNVIFNNIHNTTVINNVINQPPVGQSAAPSAGLAPIASPAAALPPAVAQRASLIQQGKAPVPPSAGLSPAARQGAPVNTAPNAAAPVATAPVQGLPKANALPVPGSRGTPPAPAAASAPAAAGGHPEHGRLTGTSPVNPASHTPAAQAPAAAGAGRPSVQPTTATPSTAAPAAAHQTRPAALPRAAAPATSPRPAAIPPASAARQAAPTPAMRAAPVPHPAAALPPPRAAAPVVRAPPPPVARPAPPPPRPAPAAVARPAPPPVRAAPPPRPAAPAAAKKCPPNVAHC